MRRRSQIPILLAVLIAQPATDALAQQQTPVADTIESDVPNLATTLNDPQAKQDVRDESAARLLIRPGDDARDAIKAALNNSLNPGAQLAAARAIADRPVADPTLVEPLFTLLQSAYNKPLVDAAGRGLTVFKNDPVVVDRLLGLATGGGDIRIRTAAIRSAATYPSKAVVQTLLKLADPKVESEQINRLGEDGLAYVTGFDRETTELSVYRSWWEQQRAKSDGEFAADLLRSRAARYDAARASRTDFEEEVARVFEDQYKRTPREGRTEVLLRHLRSQQASVRAIGAKIATDAAQTDLTSLPIKEQLRLLVGDSSSQVRLQVAQALALINDADAVDPLLTQLVVEQSPAVRGAIARALRPIRDVRSVAPLMVLLDDPRQQTAQAAAVALGEPELGAKLRTADPALAEKCAARLWATLSARTTPQNNIELRNDLVRAMVAVGSKSLARDLARLLSGQAEDPKVVRSLLAAVGALHDPQLAGAIVPWIDNPNDPLLRLAAVQALGESRPSFGEFQNKLAERIDPAKEKRPEVRDAAWVVLSELFLNAPTNQLVFWVDKLKDQPRRQMVPLMILRDRAKADSDIGLAAARNHEIGEAAMRAEMYDDAIAAYKDALRVFVSQKRLVQEEFVSEGLMKATLRAARYDDAVAFAQGQIRKDIRFQQLLAPLIRLEAERLIETKEFDAAQRLIAQALKMDPLAAEQRAMLQQLDQNIRNELNKRNLNPAPNDTASQLAGRTT